MVCLLAKDTMNSTPGVISFHDLNVFLVVTCSVGKVPRAPKLTEWTERASKFDKLKTPVSLILL